jgi:diguanylate cyclase (GGDEF)-like protein/PAS domain S-box-containing protein
MLEILGRCARWCRRRAPGAAHALLDLRLKQAAVVMATAREGILITDAAGRITEVNQAFSEVSGYAAAEVLGQTPVMLRSGRHDAAFYANMWECLARAGWWQGEIWNRRKSGEVYPEMLTIRAVRDGGGQVSSYVGVFDDISMSKASEARLQFVQHHDPLTGFPNRVLFMSLLEHSIRKAQRDHAQLAVLIIDVDRFKDVNDSFGHALGDRLLQLVGERLKTRLRAMDTVARLGGDEFALMLETVNGPDGAAGVADEIIAMMDRPFQLATGIDVHVAVSIGLSLFPEHGSSASDLLQHADAALYRAKSEGRGCYRYFSEDLTTAARHRIGLEARLHRAVAQNELRVFYQPQVNIATGRIEGAEALVRWQDPVEGLMSPARFIPIAEDSGLISEIGAWVLRQTCLQGQRWREAGLPPLRLAVNLSPKQFLRNQLESMITSALADSGFPPNCLELELTESGLIEGDGPVLAMLNRLRAAGLRVAIDDFGTGYSSLSYLRRFSLDVLKIDKSFVDGLPQEKDGRAIVAAIVAMGHTLGFTILAEGVENPRQLDFLRAVGCELYQGYLCSPPVPAEQFAALVLEQESLLDLH